MYPFERFTEAAKKALTLAQEEAELSHHSYIGTEHMLLGLIRQGDGVAAKSLASLGIELDRVRTTIDALLGRNERIIIQQIIPTSRVKKVIELAFEEARQEGSPSVDTGHLLTALLLEGEGIAAHVLVDLGAGIDRVRPELEMIRRSGITEEGAAAREAFFIWVQVGSRVLYHDPEPPFRLWEGRVVAHDARGDPPVMNVTVSIDGHPSTREVSVRASELHRVPMASTVGCERCRHGRDG